MSIMTMPGFTADAGVYRAARTYSATWSEVPHGGSVIEPQFRSRVRRQCGPCVDGTRICFLWGYECTVVEGSPGSSQLGIPPGEGDVHCEPGVFREWEQAC